MPIVPDYALDQTEDALFKWETIHEERDTYNPNIEQTQRMLTPQGWLYRTRWVDSTGSPSPEYPAPVMVVMK